MITQLHFLHPAWFIALLPLAGLLWLLFHYKAGEANAWSKVIDANLLPLLLTGKSANNRSSRAALILLAIAWLLGVIALADPVWEKIPRPVFQTKAARVIVLDLSRSMLIPDLKPSRLARARFKVEDILSRNEEGQTGLVVFAGDAFTASPLTRDADTIRSLLQVLTPDIMPAQGSRADLGLLKAQALLKQAGVQNGQVLLITDGVVGDLAEIASKTLKKNGYTVSVMGVGTEAGGPIPGLRTRDGKPVIDKLDSQALQQVAQQGGGRYHLITSSNADLQQLLNSLTGKNLETNDVHAASSKTENSDLKSQDWKSNGPWLVLLLLPLAALAFRRGWLLNIVLLVGVLGVTLQPQQAMAFSFGDLWQRPDQQADKALRQQQYEQASKLAKDPMRLGSVEYKQGKFKQALDSFSRASGADAEYNKGNALAKLKKYEDAIKAYDEALKQKPDLVDARENKEALKKMLEQQKNQDNNKKNKQQEQKKNQKSNGGKKNAQQKEPKQGNKSDKQAPEKNDKNQKQGEKKKNKQKSEGKEGKDQKAGDQQQQDINGKTDKQQDKKGNKHQRKQQKNQKGKQNQDKKQDKNQFSEAAKQLEKDKKRADKKSANEKSTMDKNTEQQQKKQAGNEDLKKEKEKKQKKKNEGKKEQKAKDETGVNAEAEELSKEEKMAAEQWLRRIPDDPGGLLRRKFIRQYKQRQRRQSHDNLSNPW